MDPRVMASARKHGVDDEDMWHAWRHVYAATEQEYDGETRILAVGPDRAGNWLELVLVPVTAPSRVIHAAIARPAILRAVGLE